MPSYHAMRLAPYAADKRLAFLEWMASAAAASPALLSQTGMPQGNKYKGLYSKAVVVGCGHAYSAGDTPRAKCQRSLVRLAAGKAICQLQQAS